MAWIPVTVKKTIEVTNNPHDAQDFYVDFCADADHTLSEYYGKNIRQGNSFKLRKIELGIQPKTNDGQHFDSGLAVQCQGVFTPTTKHTRRAWNQLFEEWKKQKTLKGVVGSTVRYDDFELAWNDEHANVGFLNRRSVIYAGGIGDTDGQEALAITGGSVSGQILTLQDYYVRRNPIVPPSQTPFGGVVKEPKFDSYWPEVVELNCSAVSSSVVTTIEPWIPSPGIPDNAYSGANVSSVPWEGDVNVFCGSMHWFVYVTPDDTSIQYADKAELTMTFWIESWKPLVYKARKARSRSNTRRFKRAYRGRKSGYRSRRRYKRRY